MDTFPPSESDFTSEQWKEKLEAEHEAAEHYANERDDLRHRVQELEQALEQAEKDRDFYRELHRKSEAREDNYRGLTERFSKLAQTRMDEIRELWAELNKARAALKTQKLE